FRRQIIIKREPEEARDEESDEEGELILQLSGEESEISLGRELSESEILDVIGLDNERKEEERREEEKKKREDDEKEAKGVLKELEALYHLSSPESWNDDDDWQVQLPPTIGYTPASLPPFIVSVDRRETPE